jgi:hypothetical protein
MEGKKILFNLSILIVIYVIIRIMINKYYEKYIKYESSEYISSYNFIYACDHHLEFPTSESTELPLTYPKSNGETIYINTTAIPNFIKNYLPYIKYKFVLLSGDTDKTIPNDYQNETQIILNNPLLIKWYAQNSVLITDKLCQLPIGLDLHTLTKIALWGDMKSVSEQINDLEMIKSIQVNKQNKCYGNFHFSFANIKYGYDRKDAYNKIPKELMYYEPQKVPRIDSWTKMIEYKYVISPLGNGLDCHRTWEAIILGCIPIVKKSELDSMYEGLPVLIVNDWSDINQDMLNNFKPDTSKIEKIYMTYWRNLITPFSLKNGTL